MTENHFYHGPPGKYDQLCNEIREQEKARAVFVLVLSNDGKTNTSIVMADDDLTSDAQKIADGLHKSSLGVLAQISAVLTQKN